MARKTTKIEIPESKIRNVIWMLKTNKTKKSCCEYLGIAYNTTRLNKIIEDFKVQEEHAKEQKAKKKGQPVSEADIKYIITSYLEGEAVSKIAERLFITSYKVNKVLKENNVPLRGRGKKTAAKTEHVIQDLDIKFKKGDRVFIAKYSLYADVLVVYDENYIEEWSDGYSKAIELSTKPKSDEELKLGIHYEEYWVKGDVLTNWKTRALQKHLSNIENLIVETGREYYKLWVDNGDGPGTGFKILKREELFPVIEV